MTIINNSKIQAETFRTLQTKYKDKNHQFCIET